VITVLVAGMTVVTFVTVVSIGMAPVRVEKEMNRRGVPKPRHENSRWHRPCS